MIKNNLTVLLAERNLKANRVANDTKIARSTLSSLTQNNSKMIQLETINTICQYLKIAPTDFFEFVPFDFDYYFETDDKNTAPKEAGNYQCYDATLFINVSENKKRIESVEFSGWFEIYNSIDDRLMTGTGLYLKNNEQLNKLNKYTQQLSASFLTDIQEDIQQFVQVELNNENGDIINDFSISFNETQKEFSKKINNRKSNS